MSRITGSDAKALMEAYAAVYAPQELTEEQVWEEVENWVNSLVEEGYDLSEYTWEDMYEAYLNEAPMTAFQAGGGSAALAASSQRRNVRGGGTAMVPTKTRAQIETQGQQNLYKAGGGDAAIRASAQNRNVRGGGTRQVPTLSRQDIINRGAAAAGASTPRPSAPAAPARPGAPATSSPAGGAKVAPTAPKPSGQTGNKAKDMATWAKANPTLASKVTPAGTQKGTGQSTMAKQAAELRAMRPATPAKAVSAAPSTSPAASGSVAPVTAKLAATPKPIPAAPMSPREKSLSLQRQSYEYDAYDVVLEYLLDNGHVDTVDEAHYVMMEMDAEMIADICEGIDFKGAAREQARRDAEQEKRDKEVPTNKERRLMKGRFRPGASSAERAEGGRDALKQKGKVPKKGGKDMFEQVLEHLISEGYAETEEAAREIIANMSEGWMQSIVEQSAIASRTAAVVDDQRRGSHGMAHDQRMTGDSIKKLNRYKGPIVTPGLPGA